MAYIGQQPVVGRYILLDQISGGFNGTTSGFTMSTAGGVQGVKPGLAQNVLLSLGGVIQQPGVDYTISGSGITFTTPPVSGTTFFATVLGDAQSVGTPSDGTVTPASIAAGYDFAFPNVNVTGVTTIASGSAATPSLSITGDADTGFLSPAANTIAVSTSGGERLRIDSNGVLIASHASVDGGVIGTNDNELRLQADINADGTGFTTFYTGLLERVRINNSGQLLVGTTTGDGQLEVRNSNGIISRAPSTQATDTNKGLRVRNNSDTDTFSISYKGQGYFAGRVGIGESTPAAGLDLKVNTNPVLAIDRGSANTANFNLQYNGTLTGQLSAANADFQISAAGSSTPMSFFTNGSERMRIDSSGRLLVQSSSAPTQGLYSQYAPLTIQGYIGSTTGNGILNLARGTTASSLSSGSDIGTIVFSDSTGGEFSRISCFADAAPGSNDYPGRISFHTTADGSSSPTERMRIDSSGRVKIEQSSADKQFRIISTDSSGASMLFQNSTTGTGSNDGLYVGIDSTETGYLWHFENKPLVLGTNNTERMRIDSSGRLLVGTSSSVSTGSSTAGLQLHNTTSSNGAHLSVARFNNDSTGGKICIAKSRSTSVSAGTIVQNNDALGVIEFAGDDGTDMLSRGAEIHAKVDGTPGANDLPCRLEFRVTADGSNSPTERMRIDSSGNVGIGTNSPSGKLDVQNGANRATKFEVDSVSGDNHIKSFKGTNENLRNLRLSANVFAVGTGLSSTNDASERMRIDSSGRLLVGATSSRSVGGVTAKFEVEGTGSDASISLIRNTNNSANPYLLLAKSRGTSVGSSTIVSDDDYLGAIYFAGADGTDLANIAAEILCRVDGTPGSNDIPGRLEFKTSSGSGTTTRLRITSGGKIQVTGTRGGTLQPSDNDSLELYTSATTGNASTGGGITFYNNHGNGHVMGGVIHVVKANGVYENSSSDMLFGTRINGSDVAYRARLTSVGDWQTFSTNVNIDISNTQSSGNNEAFIYARHGSTSMGAGTLSFRVYTNGNVQNTNNSYGSISDQNLKENIIDATSQWDDIKALQVRKYNFREATGHQTHTQLGLIAQEVETVSPGLVETTDVREGETVLDADGNQLESIKSINYSVLYMKAVKALQEAQTRIETLETQNTAQQTQIDDLLARVTALEA